MKQQIIYYIYIILFFLLTVSFGQTNSFGNFVVYTYETSRTGLGLLTTSIHYPDYLNNYTFEQTGAMYTHQYFSDEIAKINALNNLRFRFITEGNFNIGGGYSSNILEESISNSLYTTELKMYTAKIDLYSLDIAAETTFVFPNSMAVTLKLGMNIFSIGANVAMPDGGKIKDDMFGVVNLVPLLFRPQLFIDFGRSILGIGFLIHSKNFIEYKYVPTTIFDSEDKGIIFNDDFMTNFAVQVFFRY